MNCATIFALFSFITMAFAGVELDNLLYVSLHVNKQHFSETIEIPFKHETVQDALNAAVQLSDKVGTHNWSKNPEVWHKATQSMFPFEKAVFSYKIGQQTKNEEIKSLTEKKIASVEGVKKYNLHIYLSYEHGIESDNVLHVSVHVSNFSETVEIPFKHETVQDALNTAVQESNTRTSRNHVVWYKATQIVFPFEKAVFSYKIGQQTKKEEIKSLTEKTIGSVEGVTDYNLDIYLSYTDETPSGAGRASEVENGNKLEDSDKHSDVGHENAKIEIRARWYQYDRFSAYYDQGMDKINLDKSLTAQHLWKEVKNKWPKIDGVILIIPGKGKTAGNGDVIIEPVDQTQPIKKLKVQVNGEEKPEVVNIEIVEGTKLTVSWHADIHAFQLPDGTWARPRGL